MSESPEVQRVLGRIRKMLALANDAAASEGERENALRMAHATMAKYNLDLENVSQAERDTDPRAIIKKYFYGRPWARDAAGAIADMLFCRYFFTTAKRATDCGHWFVGRTSNATTAGELAEYVVKSIWSEGHRRARINGGGNEYARNFSTGAAAEIRRRCMALKAGTDQSQATPGTALVPMSFYEREQAANDDWQKHQFKTRNRPQYRKELSRSDALAAGADYGRTVSLNRQVK